MKLIIKRFKNIFLRKLIKAVAFINQVTLTFQIPRTRLSFSSQGVYPLPHDRQN